MPQSLFSVVSTADACVPLRCQDLSDPSATDFSVSEKHMRSRSHRFKTWNGVKSRDRSYIPPDNNRINQCDEEQAMIGKNTCSGHAPRTLQHSRRRAEPG